MASLMRRLIRQRRNNMLSYTQDIKKKVETLTGEEIFRKGRLVIELAENADEAEEILGDNMWKWAVWGALAYSKIVASNSLLGDAEMDKTKRTANRKLRKQFRDSLVTLTDVCSMESEDAVEMLLKNVKFSGLQTYLEALKTAPSDYVFAEQNPEPRWFSDPRGVRSLTEETEETEEQE